MSLFPIFLKLRGRRCVVVGGGTVAESKILSLLEAEARVVVIAPETTASISAWAQTGGIEWRAKSFEPGDLEGAFLVIAATSAPGVNQDVFRAAEVKGILCNAVDDPERCDFYYGAVVRRGALQIAISTEGRSPALAQRLRRDLEAHIGPDYEAWVEWLGRIRGALRSGNDDPEKTRELLHVLASHEMFQKFLRAARGKKTNERFA
jgi:precorrin-2 dehydrogenase/sirohydrochlorin ferrochelatase